jgi:hypothetical protein
MLPHVSSAASASYWKTAHRKSNSVSGTRGADCFELPQLLEKAKKRAEG